MGYIIFYSVPGLGSQELFVIACCLTAITLFVLGAIKTKVTAQKWYLGASMAWPGLVLLLCFRSLRAKTQILAPTPPLDPFTRTPTATTPRPTTATTKTTAD